MFFVRMLQNKELREDLIDITIAENCSQDKARSFGQALREHGE
jgi:hypothetical protein